MTKQSDPIGTKGDEGPSYEREAQMRLIHSEAHQVTSQWQVWALVGIDKAYLGPTSWDWRPQFEEWSISE